MSSSISRTDKEIIEIYNRNLNTIYKICFMYMKNKYDTEDMVQSTFIKMLEKNICFETLEHEKAWLIVTATNMCKNKLKHWWRSNKNIDEYEFCYNEKEDDTITLLLDLPDKYKTVMYMFYYEDYKTVEIASILKINESTIRSYLLRGRKMLKFRLEDLNE